MRIRLITSFDEKTYRCAVYDTSVGNIGDGVYGNVIWKNKNLAKNNGDVYVRVYGIHHVWDN